MLTGGRVTDIQPNVDPAERTGSPLPTPVAAAEGKSPHRIVRGLITDLTSTSVTFVKPNAEGNYDDIVDSGADAPADRRETIQFDYCVYALGGVLSEPSDAWGDAHRQWKGRGTKQGGKDFLARQGKIIESAKSVIVVGGGALGIRKSIRMVQC